MPRDDFSRATKKAARMRAAFLCSNPSCRCLTVCPSGNETEKFIYTGDVAHITAASAGGPRYDPKLTEDQRSSIDNAIHLCATCARMIDNNAGLDFPVDTVRKWKVEHEQWVKKNLNRRFSMLVRDEQARKDLILQMGSPTNSVAIEAVRALRAQGVLQDGTLEGVNLSGADLRHTDLSDACLRGADLSNLNLQDANLTNANFENSLMKNSKLRRANLEGTNLENVDLTGADLQDADGITDCQLARVRSLLGATMVKGKRYNGRFNLESDRFLTHFMKIGKDDQAMARFYGVNVKNYQWGQRWNKLSQYQPQMYSPDLDEWSKLDEDPEGIYDND